MMDLTSDEQTSKRKVLHHRVRSIAKTGVFQHVAEGCSLSAQNVMLQVATGSVLFFLLFSQNLRPETEPGSPEDSVQTRLNQSAQPSATRPQTSPCAQRPHDGPGK